MTPRSCSKRNVPRGKEHVPSSSLVFSRSPAFYTLLQPEPLTSRELVHSSADAEASRSRALPALFCIFSERMSPGRPWRPAVHGRGAAVCWALSALYGVPVFQDLVGCFRLRRPRRRAIAGTAASLQAMSRWRPYRTRLVPGHARMDMTCMSRSPALRTGAGLAFVLSPRRPRRPPPSTLRRMLMGLPLSQGGSCFWGAQIIYERDEVPEVVALFAQIYHSKTPSASSFQLKKA